MSATPTAVLVSIPETTNQLRAREIMGQNFFGLPENGPILTRNVGANKRPMFFGVNRDDTALSEILSGVDLGDHASEAGDH